MVTKMSLMGNGQLQVSMKVFTELLCSCGMYLVCIRFLNWVPTKSDITGQPGPARPQKVTRPNALPYFTKYESLKLRFLACARKGTA